MTSRLVDLSHRIIAGSSAYPGMPQPEVTPHLTREASRAVYAEGTEFAIDRITMVGNTGTYLDSPWHRYAGGTDLAGLRLEQLADLPALVVRAGVDARAVDAALLSPLRGSLQGTAVLLHTGWDAHWGTPRYGDPAPFLTEDGARWLVEQGVALVGIDSLNIDDTSPASGGRRPAHSVLLGAGVPVVEHLTRLGDLPDAGARFTATPPALVGMGTFPVRAWARV